MRLAPLLLALTAAGCRNEANLARREKRALEESVSQAQDQVHKLNMKELEGTELTEEEKSLRQKLKEQAAEDENGGNTPEPAAEAPAPTP